MGNQDFKKITEKTAEVRLQSNFGPDFVGFPKNMPLLRELDCSQRYISTENSRGFASLHGLPNFLPVLYGFYFRRNILIDLQGFPSSTPSLIDLDLSKNELISLKGIAPNLPAIDTVDLSFNRLKTTENFPSNCPKLKNLYLNHNQLEFLEDLPQLDHNIMDLRLEHNSLRNLEGMPKRLNPLAQMTLKKNPLRSLYGITKENAEAILKSIENIYQKFQLTVRGMNLIKKCIKTNFSLDKITDLVGYYAKSPLQLAQAYIRNEFNIPKHEIDRLLHEGGFEERSIIEQFKDQNDPIVARLTENLRIQKQFSILR